MNCFTALASSFWETSVDLHLLDFGEHGVARRCEFVGIRNSAHAKQSRIAGAVGPGIHGIDHARLFADFLVKPRAAAAAEQDGQHVKNRHVGMAQFGDVPGEMEVPEFDGGFFDDLARGGLPGFLRAALLGGAALPWPWHRPRGICGATSSFFTSPATT